MRNAKRLLGEGNSPVLQKQREKAEDPKLKLSMILLSGGFMEYTTRKLGLGPLPKSESIKLAFSCPVSLKAVDVATLIPHMLEAFMAEDRGFKTGRGTDLQQTFRTQARVIVCKLPFQHSYAYRPVAYSIRIIIAAVA